MLQDFIFFHIFASKNKTLCGLAWQYRDYNKDESYAEAERLARENKKGLWVYKNPVRPQDFRKQNRNKNK